MVARGIFLRKEYSYNLDDGQRSNLIQGKVYEMHIKNGEYCDVIVPDRDILVHAPIEYFEILPCVQEAPPKSDRPDSEHYHTGGIDVWKFAEANFSYDEVFGFHRIDAIKYLTRFGKKQGRNIRDLEKARAEIDEMIRMEKERAEND